MAIDTIRRIFFTPPIAIARLGGSVTPVDAFDWVPGDPHTVAETRIRPTWTLDVLPDGSVRPRMPRRLVLRDGRLLRPVAPFLELWALVGDGPVSALRPTVVTTGLLAANGSGIGSLTFTVEAMNRKAARRVAEPALRFGTFPPVRVRGNTHTAVDLRGESPPGVARPMIPRGRSIPLGRVQVLRPVPQPVGQPWSSLVRVDAVRVRFTPARGRFYGPPQAAEARPNQGPAVPRDRAFLSADAGWFGAARTPWVVPSDTFDERTGRSLGVVDDACDARIDADLQIGAARFRCHANVAVGPPHYAPDRRTFLSIADEVNDREHDPDRDTSLDVAERDEWIEDLFERVFETVANMDVDHWRLTRGRPLSSAEQRSPIPGDGAPQPGRAMGATDRLRDPEIAIAAPSNLVPQPVAQRARERHRNLSDVAELKALVRDNPTRMEALVRRPFGNSETDEGTSQSMQMPPFMRNSNANALALSWWQYELLMAWVDDVASAPSPAGTPAGRTSLSAGADEVPPLSPAAAERRQRVLDTLEDVE